MMKVVLSAMAMLGAATCIGQTVSVNLTWNDPNPPGATDAACVYHSETATATITNWAKIATVPSPTAQASVALAANRPHFFYVTLSNIWGESHPKEVGASPPVLKAPVNVRASAGTVIAPARKVARRQ